MLMGMPLVGEICCLTEPSALGENSKHLVLELVVL